jgi:hypothetical protein
MKTNLILLAIIFALASLNINCSHSNVCDAWVQVPNASWIVGCWKVYKMSGGIGGETIKLHSNDVYVFRPDSTFEKYVEDTLAAHGTYSILSESRAQLKFNPGSPYSLGVLLGKDGDISMGEKDVIDGFWYFYKRQ